MTVKRRAVDTTTENECPVSSLYRTTNVSLSQTQTSALN